MLWRLMRRLDQRTIERVFREGPDGYHIEFEYQPCRRQWRLVVDDVRVFLWQRESIDLVLLKLARGQR